jgi:hypothetical protein
MGCDNQIASENELTTGSDRVALNRCDERKAGQSDEPRRFLQRLLPLAKLGRPYLARLDIFAMLTNFTDIVACEKSPAFARDHGAPDGQIGVERPNVVPKFLPGLNGHGIELCRTVENNPRDTTTALHFHGGSHACLS